MSAAGVAKSKLAGQRLATFRGGTASAALGTAYRLRNAAAATREDGNGKIYLPH